MSGKTFFILFGVTWILAMAYGVSAWRLLARVQHLKSEGKAPEAPDPLTNPLELFGYLGWLLGGRYGELDDAAASRWAAIAQPLFIVAAPLLLAVFAMALTQSGGWSQPR
jgi:hypothetical protein